MHKAILQFGSTAVYVTSNVSLSLCGGRTPIGVTLMAGAKPLSSVAVGIVQFASAVPFIFNETRMSKGQVFSKDGGITSGTTKGEGLALVRKSVSFRLVSYHAGVYLLQFGLKEMTG